MRFPKVKTTGTCELCGAAIRWDRNRWRTETGDPVCPRRRGTSGRRHIAGRTA